MACDALQLAEDGGFSNLTSAQKQNAIFGLLCAILQVYDPMAECDAISLAEGNPCFNCLTPGQKQGAIFGLLCNILSSIPAGTAALYEGDGDPNGVVTAVVGSQYTQKDAPGVEWLKVIGAGDTGWAVNS